MTAPSPSPGPSPTQPNSVQLNSDGTPNLGGGAASVAAKAGPVTLWDVPTELTNYLAQMSGGKLWFDVGHKPAKYETINLQTGAAHSPDIGVQTGAPLEPGQTVRETLPGARREKVHGPTSYQILKSPEQVMQQFMAMSASNPAEFMALQKALAAGPWGTVHLNGAFDHDTEAALGNAMLQYVKLSMGTGVGMSFTQYLLQTGARAQALGGDGTSLGSGNGTKAPFQANLTDPTAIKDAAMQAAQQALGQGLSPDQLNAFVAQFQSAQTSAEQAAYNNKGTITSPDLSSQAMQFAQQSNPQEYKQNQRQSFMDTLVNMFAPSGSQRPTMTPTPAAG